ncbi:Phosphatidylserine decarboxylase [Theileria parva strain Muguga]|uniref:Phosphatidylserine decarboxylase n=1 Tax=Theileria parva strain Muguga TaxID=333668 RepID=UPI001C6189F1|nr:Phosphatidylserine decarboxylase [Theileria parva strain Muguga]EAN34457.2 Phosphatidylserine decarboxylase [Theileria parva strain Muguga]
MVYSPVSSHGFILLGLLSLLTSASLSFSYYASYFLLFLLVFVVYFFRDPKRSVPFDDSLVLSPADGTVTSVKVVDSPLGDGSKLTRISVFLSITNVHVNRSPVTGVVKSVEYKKGKFLNALDEDSATKNQMIRTVFKTTYGDHTLVVEQLAGLIARRVVCDLDPGNTVKLGSRMGIIKFGSRVNVFLPKDMKPLVSKGQKVRAGETIFAYMDPRLNTKELTYHVC